MVRLGDSLKKWRGIFVIQNGGFQLLGLWAELPIIVGELPEGWRLPSKTMRVL